MVHEWWLAMTGGWWLMFHADWWLVVDDSSWIMDDLIASNWWSIIIDDYLMCIDGQWCVMNDVDWSWLMVVDQDWLMMRDYQTFVPDSEVLLTLHDWWWVIMIDNDLFMLSDWWWLTIPMMVDGEHWWWWWGGGGGELCETLETFNSVYVVFFNPGCVIEGCNHSRNEPVDATHSLGHSFLWQSANVQHQTSFEIQMPMEIHYDTLIHWFHQRLGCFISFFWTYFSITFSYEVPANHSDASRWA